MYLREIDIELMHRAAAARGCQQLDNSMGVTGKGFDLRSHGRTFIPILYRQRSWPVFRCGADDNYKATIDGFGHGDSEQKIQHGSRSTSRRRKRNCGDKRKSVSKENEHTWHRQQQARDHQSWLRRRRPFFVDGANNGFICGSSLMACSRVRGDEAAKRNKGAARLRLSSSPTLPPLRRSQAAPLRYHFDCSVSRSDFAQYMPSTLKRAFQLAHLLTKNARQQLGSWQHVDVASVR